MPPRCCSSYSIPSPEFLRMFQAGSSNLGSRLSQTVMTIFNIDRCTPSGELRWIGLWWRNSMLYLCVSKFLFKAESYCYHKHDVSLSLSEYYDAWVNKQLNYGSKTINGKTLTLSPIIYINNDALIQPDRICLQVFLYIYACVYVLYICLYFSNGDLDPWSAFGVLNETSAPGATVIRIGRGAHHLDLRGSHPNDTAEVKAARSLIRDKIVSWIDEWHRESHPLYCLDF